MANNSLRCNHRLWNPKTTIRSVAWLVSLTKMPTNIDNWPFVTIITLHQRVTHNADRQIIRTACIIVEIGIKESQ